MDKSKTDTESNTLENRHPGPHDGIFELVHSKYVSYERLPMLEVVCNKFVQTLSTTLRNFSKVNVEVNLIKIDSVRFGEFLNTAPLPSMFNIINITEWSGQALLVVGSELFYGIVDILLGGRKPLQSEGNEARSFTSIELALIERFVRIVVKDFSDAFEAVEKVSIKLERYETTPKFAMIAHPTTAAIMITIKISMDFYSGYIQIIIPNSTIEPVREKLLQMYTGEKMGRDDIWENHMRSEIIEASIDLTVILKDMTLSLNETINWKVGSFLRLDVDKESLIEVRAGERLLFSGRMGNIKGRLAIRVDETYI